MPVTMPGNPVSFPVVHATERGLRVQVSMGAYLPGHFRNYLDAERAIAKYKGTKAQAKSKSKRK